MNQIIVNNVNALVAALQNLSDKDMELKRKDVLLDLGHNGHSRQYLQVSYMYDCQWSLKSAPLWAPKSAPL